MDNILEPAEVVVTTPSEDEKLDYSEWNGMDTIESLCISCGSNGITRLMLHKIPNFRELIIASFYCDYCGERNNEVTFGGEIQIQGCIFTLQVATPEDLDRQMIKSDSASLRIPALDFEIPALTQKGEISTLEGFLKTAAKNLSLYQAERMKQMPEVGEKVADIILKLTMMANGVQAYLPFEIILDDPAGNSFIQNPLAPAKDPFMKTTYYFRSPQQDISLGLQPDKGVFRDDKESNFSDLISKPFGSLAVTGAAVTAAGAGDLLALALSAALKDGIYEDSSTARLGRSEVIKIPSHCPNCTHPGEALTALTDIPHFKEILIMAFNCSSCGFRNNEVKGGGAVPDKGSEVTLRVQNLDDLKRDVLKSDSAMVIIPEIELELQHGTLGGLYTTVEGLVTKIHKSLAESNPFAIGDSATLHHSSTTAVSETKKRFMDFMDGLQALGRGERLPFTLTLRDPLGNSFISAPLGSFLPPEMDHSLTVSDFQRSWDENEEFGLNDINTKDFETGVDYSQPILADRLTHLTEKGLDHPSLFAKGMEDATPGGVYFPKEYNSTDVQLEYSATVTVLEKESDSSSYYCTGPAGWSFTRQGSEVQGEGGTGSSVEVGNPNTMSAPYNGQEKAVQVQTQAEEVQVQEEDLLLLPYDGYGKRQFDDDSSLQFEAREEFAGRRVGFVFRLGSMGLGYYQDIVR